MATNQPAEEIIEKRDTSALAVTCLVIACAALLGAIVFQLMELGEYKRGGVNAKYAQSKTPAQSQADADIKVFKDKVNELITKSAEAAAAPSDEGAATAGEGDAQPKDGADETTDEKATSGDDAKADGDAAKEDGDAAEETKEAGGNEGAGGDEEK